MTFYLSQKYVAIVPLVVFAAGFVVSFALRAMNKEAGRKVSVFVHYSRTE